MGRGLQSDFILSQWHSKCALETISWEVDRNANTRPLLRPAESETPELGLSNLCFKKPTWGLWHSLSHVGEHWFRCHIPSSFPKQISFICRYYPIQSQIWLSSSSWNMGSCLTVAQPIEWYAFRSLTVIFAGKPGARKILHVLSDLPPLAPCFFFFFMLASSHRWAYLCHI